MANDYIKKEPTKAEKMIYELYVQMQDMQRSMWSTSSVVMASAILNKVDPKALAELLANGDEKLKAYSKQVNDHIQELEKAKHKDHDHAEGEQVNSKSSEPAV